MTAYSSHEGKEKKAASHLVEKPSSKEALDLNNPDLLDLQQMIGNRAVNRLLGQQKNGRLQMKPIQRAPMGEGGATAGAERVTPPTPTDYSKMSENELRAQYVAIQINLSFLQFPPFDSQAPLWQQETEKIKQALIDKTVQAEIKSLLNQFQTISVFIPGTSQPLSPGQMGPPAPKAVTFHAAYFINRDEAKTHVKGARDASHFGDIVKSGNKSGETSLIKSSGKEYGSGSAVRGGKATPENVQQFVQEALNNGTLQKYAIQKGTIAENQQLSSLNEAGATKLVQDWVIDNGVGVDCSGFVLQAAVHARDAVRNQLRGLGVAENKLPKELSHEERRAKSFDQGTKVKHPRDLRPGDAWVLNDGGHIKIVIDTRQTTNDEGEPIIEFDTAESAGDSTHTEKGPTQKTKQTKNLMQFGLGGSFHRI